MKRGLMFVGLVLFLVSFVSALDISSCQTLSNASIVYTLTNDVASNGTCFTVAAENVVLDCEGHKITYSTEGGASQYGVYSDQNYTKIRNCVIENGGLPNSNRNKHGIYFYEASHGEIINNSLRVHGYLAKGIYLYSNSKYNTLIDNVAVSDSGDGIYFGLFSSFANITNNKGTSGSSSGILFHFSSNNVIKDNFGTSNFSGGIILQHSSDNIFTNNTGVSFSSPGIYMMDSLNNIITGNKGVSNSGNGIDFELNSDYNNLTKNVGISVSGSGIYFLGCFNNNLKDNMAVSDSGSGIYLQASSNYNNLTGNTAASNSSYGVFIETSKHNMLSKTETSGVYGYALRISESNKITDCSPDSSNFGIYIESSPGSTNNVFLNCSYGSENVNGIGNYFFRKWYIENVVSDSQGGFLSGANVNIKNISSSNVFDSLTNSLGQTFPRRFEAIEYMRDSVGYHYATPHTIEISKTDYIPDSAVYNLSVSNNIKNEIVLAYNYTAPSSTCGDADGDGNGSISITELIDYIGRWKAGDVTITELINGIGEWKSGCS